MKDHKRPRSRHSEGPVSVGGLLPFPRVQSCRTILIGMAFVVGGFLAPSHVDAQVRIGLPIEAALETPRVELDLTDARVVITVDSARTARFSARSTEPGSGADVSLLGSITPRAVTRIWRPDTGIDLPKIIVEVNLAPDQVLALNGNRLDLEITFNESDIAPDSTAQPTAPEDHDAAADEGSPGGKDLEEVIPAISVGVVDSTFRAAGLRDLNLSAIRSTIDLDFISAPLKVEIDESEFHAQGISGSADLHAIASEVVFIDTHGGIALTLDGGHLTANRGTLDLTGEVSNTGIELVSIEGSIQLDGTGTSLRITDGNRLPVKLTGTDLDIVLEEVSGPVRANLVGGRIAAGSIDHRFDLRLAEGAESDLDTLRSDLAIVMFDGASARVHHVSGHTRVQLEEGELEISDLKSLELRAWRGLVTGSEIRNLTRVELTDTEADITLEGIQGNYELLLQGSTAAVVRLPVPCRVAAKMPDTSAGDQLRVSGCLLDFDGSVKRGMQRGIDGQPPIRLNATLDESATLEVFGLY